VTRQSPTPKGPCIFDDSTECDCPRCSVAEKRFWAAQGNDRTSLECDDECDGDGDGDDDDRVVEQCTCVLFPRARGEADEIICPWCGRPR